MYTQCVAAGKQPVEDPATLDAVPTPLRAINIHNFPYYNCIK